MGSFLNWYLDTTQNLCLARDCVLAVRGSGTISASCSLLPFPVLADDRDGDADDEESRRRRRRREGPVLPPAAAADLDVECRRRKQSNGFLLFLPAIIVLSCFRVRSENCIQLTRMKVSFCVGRSKPLSMLIMPGKKWHKMCCVVKIRKGRNEALNSS